MLEDISRDKAERACLGAVLLHPTKFDQTSALCTLAERLKVEDFKKPAHRRIYKAMRLMSTRGEIIDPVTLSNHLDATGDLNDVGGPAYLMRLIDDVPRAESLTAYAKYVQALVAADADSAEDILAKWEDALTRAAALQEEMIRQQRAEIAEIRAELRSTLPPSSAPVKE